MAPDGSEVQVLAEDADTTTLTDAASTVSNLVSISATITGQTTAVTGCHAHETATYCINGNGEEVQVIGEATATGELPAQYTDCHSHGDEQYCMAPDGSEVQVLAEGAATSDEESDTDGEEEMDCHFHAGVEHCVAAGGSESSSSETELNCSVTQREYDIPLRIGTLFLILVTSALGVFLPMLLKKLPSQSLNALIFTAVKQFGTGVILSTALIHLFTHASLMFNNECLGVLEYEGTTAAIVMAGIILAFLFEFVGHRIIHVREQRHSARNLATSEDGPDAANAEGKDSNTDAKGSAYVSNNLTNLGHSHGNPHDPANPNSKLSVMVMEAGILFHSILIGLTLVVAGDSFYKTLLVVIVFHQFFEGLALGARIALLPSKFAPFWRTKIWMAIAYALITPIGMAIGIGVIHDFNGNDKSTILAIGTLDAISAGILLWVGVVDMLARDWVLDGGIYHCSLIAQLSSDPSDTMSALKANVAVKKQFGKGERHVPHHSQKASKWYPTHTEPLPRKTRKAVRPTSYRPSLEPGTVLILLAGRFRGKRVVLLKHLSQGALLITGPFKLNGVPLRRVNARYVIATSTKVDLSGLDKSTVEKISDEKYFAREKKSRKEKGEEAFLKQGEKPEKKQPSSSRAADQKSIDKPLLSAIKKEEFLASYLSSSFSLRSGQKPHEMKF
ncbi:hypothetical protein DV735_g4280, partial [Chaetothyriales sp. CBS 134920]